MRINTHHGTRNQPTIIFKHSFTYYLKVDCNGKSHVFLLARYVDLIMQCTKQHFYNQIMVYYQDIKLQSYKMLLPQVRLVSRKSFIVHIVLEERH